MLGRGPTQIHLWRKQGSISMVVERKPQLRPTLVGSFRVPATRADKDNVQKLIGAVDVLTALVREYELQVVEETGEGAGVLVDGGGHKGRRPGSTNWSQERFWRKYKKEADQMSRPYRATHLAARIGVVYTTFRNYMKKFGPPPGYAAPGD